MTTGYKKTDPFRAKITEPEETVFSGVCKHCGVKWELYRAKVTAIASTIEWFEYCSNCIPEDKKKEYHVATEDDFSVRTELITKKATKSTKEEITELREFVEEQKKGFAKEIADLKKAITQLKKLGKTELCLKKIT